jgi:putative membrane protein insertion efficiency factor
MNAQEMESVAELDHAHDRAVEEFGIENEHDHAHADETSLRDIPLRISNLPRLAGLGFIRFYQMTFSKALPAGTCRFYPSCSHYGYEAIVKHGLVKGSGLAVWRVARCQPFSKGGYDPVP